MNKFLLFIALCILPVCNGEIWAFLVAGSKGWINYRHQADLSHAYHLLIAGGVREDHIITMLYDDIANFSGNPNPGVIINMPGGPNVYEGLKKDYTKEDLSVNNVLNVIKGNKEAMKGIGSGRVLESGPEDTVFINIIDHGGPGTISINEDYLYADQLHEAVIHLKNEKRFAKMAIYVETCESGSMFDSIFEDDLKVFVMTAAAPDESSFSCYFNDQLGTFLADEFSLTWMNSVDKMRNDNKFDVTLFKEYKKVRSHVNGSHVMMYGDFHLGFDKVASFVGDKKLTTISDTANPFKTYIELPKPKHVPSRDIQLYSLKHKLEKTGHPVERIILKKQISDIEKAREKMEEIFDNIVQMVAGEDVQLYIDLLKTTNKPTKKIFPCYREMIASFNKNCINSHKNPYITKHFSKLLNLCSKKQSVDKVTEAFKKVCSNLTIPNLL